MNDDSIINVQKSKKQLESDFDHSITGYKILGNIEYNKHKRLSSVTVATGILASIAGFLNAPGKIVGLVAFCPVFFATILMNLKFQDKANWYFRKKNALAALRRELLYEFPGVAEDKVADIISKKWTELERRMDEQWEKDFAFSWTDYFNKPHRPSVPVNPPSE